MALRRRQALRRALPVGPERAACTTPRCSRQPPTSWSRGVRAAEAAGRQAQQGPRAGLRRAYLHRRRRAVPDDEEAGARHQGSVRAQRAAVRGGARAAARPASADPALLARRQRAGAGLPRTKASSPRAPGRSRSTRWSRTRQPIASTVPAEGATGWADTTMLHAGAKHPNCAYKWLEWSISPEGAGRRRRVVRLESRWCRRPARATSCSAPKAARPTASRTSTRSSSGARPKPSARRTSKAACRTAAGSTDYVAVMGGR